MSQHALTQALYEKLTADQSTGSVHSLTQGRIHHLRAPFAQTLPWLRFIITQDSAQPYFNQATEDLEAHLTIDIWTDIKNGAQPALAINDALHGLLHRATLTPQGLTNTQVFCLTRGVPEIDTHAKAIRIQSAWRIWAST